jgi:hypothetical protein
MRRRRHKGLATHSRVHQEIHPGHLRPNAFLQSLPSSKISFFSRPCTHQPCPCHCHCHLVPLSSYVQIQNPDIIFETYLTLNTGEAKHCSSKSLKDRADLCLKAQIKDEQDQVQVRPLRILGNLWPDTHEPCLLL